MPGLTAFGRSRWSELPNWHRKWILAALILALLAGCWALVYATGGTRTALPHVFYVPIVLATVPFGVPGGVITGLVATVLCGPAMPLDVATGESQQLLNWLTRGAFFTAIGAVSGTSAYALRHSFQSGLTEQLRGELELAAPRPTEHDPAWAARIREAVDTRDFRSVFQPIYSLADGRLVAMEALTRFPGDPSATPDVWFTEARHAGLGIEFELATLTAALEASEDTGRDVALTFNASPDLLTDPRLPPLLRRHRGRCLVVEVTEHAVVEDYGLLAQALAMLRSHGIELAVDDAGAGFASLRHIVRLQPDLIKLDASLTQNLRGDPVRRPLADALIQFADRIDSRIVAEGIESNADLATWRELGAHYAQGYLLAAPGTPPFPPRYEPLASRRTGAARQGHLAITEAG